jgi:hypothetical protein
LKVVELGLSWKPVKGKSEKLSKSSLPPLHLITTSVALHYAQMLLRILY